MISKTLWVFSSNIMMIKVSLWNRTKSRDLLKFIQRMLLNTSRRAIESKSLEEICKDPQVRF